MEKFIVGDFKQVLPETDSLKQPKINKGIQKCEEHNQLCWTLNIKGHSCPGKREHTFLANMGYLQKITSSRATKAQNKPQRIPSNH